MMRSESRPSNWLSPMCLATVSRIVASLVVAAAFSVAGVGVAYAAQPAKGRQAAAAQSPPGNAPAQPTKGGQAIVVLVNDEPITAYEIEQRSLFIAVNSGGNPAEFKARAEARWAQIVKDPKTNERFQNLLREKAVRSKEEAVALQKQYVSNLQREMIEQLRRESRSTKLPQFRKEAQEELIEERLKLQEAKRLGIEISEDEAKRIIKGIAERNKMTEQQFIQQVKGQGFDISTMRERFKAQSAWREVIRRRFSAQISITQGEIDRLVSASATEAGEDTVELQVLRVTLPIAGKTDQTVMAKRFTEADALRRKYGGCKTMAGLVKDVADARFDDLKFIKPSSIPEPTRSMLLSAKDGDVLPPAASTTGIEVYAVCGRRAIRADDKQREKVQSDLAQKEFEILAKRHLRDLRQDAHIELR